ncbi:MAG: hypothetical protein ACAI44_32710 [Candidatus Sericytochromatia bacterium]
MQTPLMRSSSGFKPNANSHRRFEPKDNGTLLADVWDENQEYSSNNPSGLPSGIPTVTPTPYPIATATATFDISMVEYTTYSDVDYSPYPYYSSTPYASSTPLYSSYPTAYPSYYPSYYPSSYPGYYPTPAPSAYEQHYQVLMKYSGELVEFREPSYLNSDSSGYGFGYGYGYGISGTQVFNQYFRPLFNAASPVNRRQGDTWTAKSNLCGDLDKLIPNSQVKSERSPLWSLAEIGSGISLDYRGEVRLSATSYASGKAESVAITLKEDGEAVLAQDTSLPLELNAKLTMSTETSESTPIEFEFRRK